MPRIDYPDEHYIDLRSDEHGLLARIVVRLLVVEGKRVRCSRPARRQRQTRRRQDRSDACLHVPLPPWPPACAGRQNPLVCPRLRTIGRYNKAPCFAKVRHSRRMRVGL